MQTIKFRTEYTPVRENFTLNPEKPVLLMGSCFADNISQRMQFCRWNACNPFGVLFNPLSIARECSGCLYRDYMQTFRTQSSAMKEFFIPGFSIQKIRLVCR